MLTGRPLYLPHPADAQRQSQRSRPDFGALVSLLMAQSHFPHTLGEDPNHGQYRIPGLGKWGKQTNVREAQRRAGVRGFLANPAQGPSWPGHTNRNTLA
jgi:hypothetical protein